MDMNMKEYVNWKMSHDIKYGEAEGYPLVLKQCRKNKELKDFRVYGNSIQDGTPTPENPIEVQSVGELVTEGEYAGKYKIPVRARGKNLFDLLNAPTFSHYSAPGRSEIVERTANNITVRKTTDREWEFVAFKLPEISVGATITVYAEWTCSSANRGMIRVNWNGQYEGNKIIASSQKSGVSASGVVTEKPVNSDYLGLLLYSGIVGKTGDEVHYKNIMVTIDEPSTAKPYEPYIEPQTFNIYLDEPLRKVGDYADYVDFGKDVVVRSVKHKVFNGTERWEYDASTNKNTLLYQERVTSCVALSPDRITAMSSRVGSRAWGGVWQNYYKPPGSTALVTGIATVYNMGDGAGGKWLYLKVSPYSTLPTLEEWKAQLAIWYDEGNPFTVWYVIPTIEEPIELPELPKTQANTMIYEVIDTSVQPSNVYGKYIKKY